MRRLEEKRSEERSRPRSRRERLSEAKRPLQGYNAQTATNERQVWSLDRATFANAKFDRRMDRFLRRGKSAVRSQWRLINSSHNLLKLYRLAISPAPV